MEFPPTAICNLISEWLCHSKNRSATATSIPAGSPRLITGSYLYGICCANSRSIPWWKEIATSRRRPLALLAVGCVSLSLAFTISHPIREAHYLPSHKFDAVVAQLPGLPTIGAWYPKWVSDKFLVMPQPVVAAQRSVTIGAWQSEHRIFQVSEGPATEARVHTFYYPLWRASAAGKTLATRPDEDGTLIVSLPPESVSVDLSFREPRRSLISGILSVVGWILILILIVTAGKPKATEGERRSLICPGS